MSVDAPSKTKEKKAQRDAERQKKGRKRKHEETLDVPAGAEEVETAPEYIPLDGGVDVESATPAVNAPKAKKQKRSEDAAPAATDTPAPVRADAPLEDAEAAAKRKARTHARNLRKRNKEKAAKGRQPTDVDPDAPPAAAVDPVTGEEKSSKSRFILFIGNLPFATTDAALQAHFKRLQPFTLRHRTDPKTQKSKGFAFLEFENFDRMETCLKKYHHTLFDPDDYREDAGKFGGAGSKQSEKRNKGKSKGRLINVELTAGGGGKGTERMEKIREKNVSLEEERARRAEQEALQEAQEEKKGVGSAKGRVGRKEPVVSGVNAEGVHPSRLAMLKG